MDLNLNKRIDAFATLGEILRTYVDENRVDKFNTFYKILDKQIEKAEEQNPWFTQKNILTALKNIGNSLHPDQIQHWISLYPELKKQEKKPLTIGVINAGNIPLVGFHDLMSVLISGHIYYGKLSSKDKELPAAIKEILIKTEPGFESQIIFEKEQLEHFDAIIATGSDNTSRYFDYYFRDYPHIIRKNRSSVAVLTGRETDEELKKLADDIFLYFGLGCRNVSKVYFPDGFHFNRFFENINHYEAEMRQHHKYSNNYEYNRTIYLMNQTPHLDNGFLLLREDTALSSPIATLSYEMYSDFKEVVHHLENQKDQLQCVVSENTGIKNAVGFGETQHPRLWDYADNVDTIKFILSLDK